MENNIEWLNEKIKSVPKKNCLYLFMKIFLFKWKGLSYKEMYLILQNLYQYKNDEKTAKSKALTEIIRIYTYNNNNSPQIEGND